MSGIRFPNIKFPKIKWPSKKQPTESEKKGKKIHPWRLCPIGEYWVATHPMKGTKGRRGHCRTNPSKKDQLYSAEMHEMAERYFYIFKGRPLKTISEFGQLGDAYDRFIQGWTRYWNDILEPSEPLDPDVVKALIASESGFNPKAWNKKRGPERARGLTQVTDQTLRYLTQNYKGLKDHYLNLREDDMLDPNLAICAGIRWLFIKKELSKTILKRPVSWKEAVIAFKGIKFNDEEKINKLMKDFDKFYSELKGVK